MVKKKSLPPLHPTENVRPALLWMGGGGKEEKKSAMEVKKCSIRSWRARKAAVVGSEEKGKKGERVGLGRCGNVVAR